MAERSLAGVPAWPSRLIDELNTSDRQARDLAFGLSEAALNWRPSDDRWSVGQCLHHLLVANDVYLPPIARALDGQPRSPVPDITPGWFGRRFIRDYIEPSTQRRPHRAPGKIAPAERIDPDVLGQFIRSNDVARALIRRAADYDVNRVRFRNPFVPLVRFTVGTGLEIICRHQRRHLLQAERVRQAEGFPRRAFSTKDTKIT